MKKILVLTEAYPSSTNIYNMSYVHSRNIEYMKQKVSVDVLSFSTPESYTYESINVLSINDSINVRDYDAVISHAPNIRNHYKFITLKQKEIKQLCLFFHGHEILYLNEYYPSPYEWQEQKGLIKRSLQSIYDRLKTSIIKHLLMQDFTKAVFVSNWMKTEGFKCLRIKNSDSIDYRIINNSINTAFLQSQYKFDQDHKAADFITIRPLDGKKYAIDKVIQLANRNPNFSFHIFGRGSYFEHNKIPDNVQVFDTFIEQKDIPKLLNKYRAAVMPTRLDAQGVMMCEMASYGIPIIVSDLPVCQEMLHEFSNAIFIKNTQFQYTDLSAIKLVPLTNSRIAERFNPTYLANEELLYILN